ncbi:hypothetical protein G3I24_26980, partial [Micromonospora aurantiaca]|nr:hypothetical protein [Micromonospora aurantiaca]
EARPARAVRTSGIEPVVRVVPEPDLPAAAREATERLLDQVEGTIGVIVPMSADESGTAPKPQQPASSGGQTSLFDAPAASEEAGTAGGGGVAWTEADRERLGAGLPERV